MRTTRQPTAIPAEDFRVTPTSGVWPGEPATVRAAADRLLHAGPVRRCTIHGSELDGGPVQYRCPAGHRVQAADVDHEFHGRAVA